jgi:hypothetical protein
MADFVNLYEWIHTVGPGDFPPAPYELTPWYVVRDWGKYIDWLRGEGPQGTEAKTGAIQEKLRRLYTLWNSGRSK